MKRQECDKEMVRGTKPETYEEFKEPTYLAKDLHPLKVSMVSRLNKASLSGKT